MATRTLRDLGYKVFGIHVFDSKKRPVGYAIDDNFLTYPIYVLFDKSYDEVVIDAYKSILKKFGLGARVLTAEIGLQTLSIEVDEINQENIDKAFQCFETFSQDEFKEDFQKLVEKKYNTAIGKVEKEIGIFIEKSLQKALQESQS